MQGLLLAVNTGFTLGESRPSTFLQPLLFMSLSRSYFFYILKMLLRLISTYFFFETVLSFASAEGFHSQYYLPFSLWKIFHFLFTLLSVKMITVTLEIKVLNISLVNV